MEQSVGDRPDYDQTLKRLLVRAHDGFLQLVAPGLTFRGEAESELRDEPRRADLVWEVEAPGGVRGLLHVELQTKPDPLMGERLAEYALRIWRRDHKPLRSLVVYLRPSEALPDSPFTVTDWSGQEALRFTYDIVRIWEVQRERVLETEYYELWPLAGLMGDVTPEATLQVADKIAAAPLSAKRREELTTSLVLLAGVRIPRRVIREALLRRRHMLKDIWEESSLKDALRDLVVQDDFRAVLEARFGTLDGDLIRAIEQAEAETLRPLFGPAAIETLEQIRARLGLG